MKKTGNMTPRRAEIIRIAGRLFATQGFECTSLRDIGAAVGIRRGSLYAHFDAKDEILTELILPPLVEILQTLEQSSHYQGSGAERLEHCVLKIFDCCAANRDAFLSLTRDRHLIEKNENLRPISEKARALAPLWLSVIKDGQKDDSLRDDLEPRMIAQAIYSMIFGALSDLHTGLHGWEASSAPSSDEHARLLHVVLFEGLLKKAKK